MSLRILIAYDGSPGSRAAVSEAGRLFPGAEAVVVYARQPLEGMAAHLEHHPDVEDLRRLDESTLDSSQQVAVEGAKLAVDHGLVASAEVTSTMRPPWSAIVEAASAAEASVVVLGSRGRGAIGSALLGSTSAAVTHHVGRPVLIVPAPAE
ncbi:universal stress protein [Nocardioides taihuensis]|jgi:nucleotide-binding universal stress UspA family protein|uniref:Universal stress protein n=1 Tax=Nocardioides taihuensis TaxID=1835606 RepID=A0ABW0BDV4_9ACTN